jgi:cbb3-type cytochrome c oxidase subunit III
LFCEYSTSSTIMSSFHSQACLSGKTSTTLLLMLLMLAPTPAITDGRSTDPGKIFADYCSVCHGERGDGRSHAVQGLNPPPRDFTTAEAGSSLTRDGMIAAIKHGRPGTAMTAWSAQLSDDQIEDLVDYIRSNFMSLAGSSVDTKDGKSTYASTCSVCHGEDGSGALWGKTSLNPAPVNFRTADPVNDLTRERMIVSVTHGRPGTAMTAFDTQLSEVEIRAVVEYIRDSFMSGERAPEPAGMATINPPAASTVGMAVLHGMPQDTSITAAESSLGTTHPLPSGLEGNAEVGRAYYLQNCTACHGIEGDGNGPRAYFIFPRPRNFLDADNRARLNRPALFKGIKQGVPGREMPAWGKVLSDQKIADISEYVFQNFITTDNE